MTIICKNFIKPLMFILLVSCITIGCAKLDQQPQATANKAAVFGSQTGLDLYANSFYNILPTSSSIIRGDAISDYLARTTVPDFIRTGAYSAQTSTGWSWTNLRNVNYFLENNNNTAVSKPIRENYNGIARFFRGWLYFEMVKRFGDVPWINKPFDVSDPALYSGRDSRTLIIDSVIADLDYAAAHITTNDATRSLITKNTALAFKSRVCLFEGTFRKYHTEYNLQGSANALLTASATAAQQVITTGGFSLSVTGGTDKAYRNLFNNQAIVPSETILAFIVDPALTIFTDANWYLTSATYGDRLSFTRTFINTYLSIDGTPFTNKAGYQTMTFPQEVKSRDMRLQQTIRMGSTYTRLNGGVSQVAPPVFSYTYTGYMPIKLTMDDASMDGGARNTNSLPIMRYAEVLLNLAEAKGELGTLTDADWNITIGALRRRAGITGNTTVKPLVADAYLKNNYFPDISDPVILEIRRERGIELALEGFRFYDLVRWKRGPLMEQVWNGIYVPTLNTAMDLNEDGVLDVLFYQVKPATTIAGVTYINVAPTITSGANPQRLANDTFGELTWLNTVARKWDDKFYLYPIPATDLQVNPKLGQNPGW
jgi:hypothetical protein